MTNGKAQLDLMAIPMAATYSLVFGSEGSGLDDCFLDVGTSLYIRQTEQVDSLNLTVAVGIAINAFTSANPRPAK